MANDGRTLSTDEIEQGNLVTPSNEMGWRLSATHFVATKSRFGTLSP